MLKVFEPRKKKHLKTKYLCFSAISGCPPASHQNKKATPLLQSFTPNRRLLARGRNKNTTIMLQEALILALFTLRYIQHYYSSLEIQNAFKKPTIKPYSTVSFQIASEWLPSNTVLCVNIQRLKLSRNPSSCGVCCIAFRRTSSPGEEAAPLTCRGGGPGPWAAAPFLPLGHFGNQVTTVPTSATQGGPWLPLCIFVSPVGTTATQNPARTALGGPSRSLTMPAEERHGKILKHKVLNWNPNYLAVLPANSRFIEDCVAATIQWHADLLFFFVLFFAAFRFFLKWWRVQEFRNINIPLLEVAKFSTMTLWKLTVQFIDSVLRFSTNLVSELSQSYFCLIKQYQHVLTPCLWTSRSRARVGLSALGLCDWFLRFMTA